MSFKSFGKFIKRAQKTTVKVSTTVYTSTKEGAVTAYAATKTAVSDIKDGYNSQQ